ncbi:MAG: putative WbbU [Pseudomonadota bacterium]|nr:putative WbbU [Pseudomonadota bacterium]
MDDYKILSIIVAYYPDSETLLLLVDELHNQTTEIIVIDNTPAENDIVWETLKDQPDFYPLRIVRLGKNFGIATAINIGIDVAKNEGFTHVLLSDQDSQPSFNMVANLVRAYQDISRIGFKIGAVGPTYTDVYTKITYPFQVQLPRHFFYGHKTPTPDNPHIEALTLITSGTLVPVEVFKDVGLMREDLFIDHVDIEWCHRARSKGYYLFGTGYATLYQRMGDSYLRVWYLGWRNESAYSPLRIYYRLRNFVALCRLEYISWRWKLRSSWYWTKVIYAHIFFGDHRAETLKMATKGIWHGLQRRMGQYKK